MRDAYVFAIAFVASVGGFLFGYDLAVMGVANIYLKEEFRLSDAAYGLATASATLGCATGPILGGWLCDRIGRRRTLIIAASLVGANAVCTALARDMVVFNVFRIVGGVGVGLCSIAAPLYIAEVSPPARRGALGFMFQLAIVIGCVVSIAVACGLARWLPVATSWRWMFASQVVPVLAFVICLWMIPETPRWLAARGAESEAVAVLERIGGAAYSREQMGEIRASLAQESGRFGELLEPRVRRALAFFPVMLFPILKRTSEDAIGSEAGVFWLYAGLCVAALVFGWLSLPETKGRTLEDIAGASRHD